MAIFIFLFFSVLPEGADSRSAWYLNTITIIETGAFLFASFLCFRNWQSSQIVSGREVWLSIGIGLLLYAGGNIFFYLWNNVFGLDPSVSFGDFFYLLSYVFLAIGMFKAVLPRRLNLDIKQWAIVAIIGVLGIALAVFPSLGGEESAITPTAPPALSTLIGLDAPAWAQEPPLLNSLQPKRRPLNPFPLKRHPPNRRHPPMWLRRNRPPLNRCQPKPMPLNRCQQKPFRWKQKPRPMPLGGPWRRMPF
ncbi:MAG: hypothetical protein F6K00_08760 [Leptolyngbya sp. SIOISBB]|nr:hypothetical protein [Leptolyngbya sp. SIOISBB]